MFIVNKISKYRFENMFSFVVYLLSGGFLRRNELPEEMPRGDDEERTSEQDETTNEPPPPPPICSLRPQNLSGGLFAERVLQDDDDAAMSGGIFDCGDRRPDPTEFIIDEDEMVERFLCDKLSPTPEPAVRHIIRADNAEHANRVLFLLDELRRANVRNAHRHVAVVYDEDTTAPAVCQDDENPAILMQDDVQDASSVVVPGNNTTRDESPAITPADSPKPVVVCDAATQTEVYPSWSPRPETRDVTAAPRKSRIPVLILRPREICEDPPPSSGPRPISSTPAKTTPWNVAGKLLKPVSRKFKFNHVPSKIVYPQRHHCGGRPTPTTVWTKPTEKNAAGGPVRPRPPSPAKPTAA